MQEYKFVWEYPSYHNGPGSVTGKYLESKPKSIPKLFTPLTIKNVTFKNRIVVSPMCMYSSEDGLMNDFHLVHYGGFAKGGAGLVIFEASAVQDIGRITYADAGIYNDSHIEPLKRINKFVQLHGAKTGIQIAHAGRKASTNPLFLENARDVVPSSDKNGWEVVSPSNIRWGNVKNSYDPHELTVEEIRGIVKAFGEAAKRATEVGFDVVEIHGAHGYIIDSFLSPTSNKRTDLYGGSFENRIRILLEIIQEIRKNWDISKPLFLRLSCEEWVQDGWHLSDTVKLIQIIKDTDLVDLIDCSSGGNSQSQKITSGPLYQVPFAEKIKSETNILTSAVGLISKVNDAESILQGNKADLVLFGREFLRDPFFPLHFAKDLGVDVDYTIQYSPAKPKIDY